jgi:oxygen-independent coproporphyrinogen-3 oxidase
MAGIYVHIPYCRQVCHYCDFHFTVSLKRKNDLLKALLKEIQLQQHFLLDAPVDTIYFGGGTPSILSCCELETLISHILRTFNVKKRAEISIEVNPEDITFDYAAELRCMGFNRISIGVQSFNDDDLTLLNRRHDAAKAVRAILHAQDAGFRNISIDLIYGIPELSMKYWKSNLRLAFKIGIQHLSAYHLTIEPKSVFGHFLRKGKIKPVIEQISIEQFRLTQEMAEKNGFQHYEISNFAHEGFISKHNSNYWLREPYLGIGPSAHSYNGKTRQWNVAVNEKYIESIQHEIIPATTENLDVQKQYNEYVLTSLRTSWGAEIRYIDDKFGRFYKEHFIKSAEKYIHEGKLQNKEGNYTLTGDGKFISDFIINDFFVAG